MLCVTGVYLRTTLHVNVSHLSISSSCCFVVVVVVVFLLVYYCIKPSHLAANHLWTQKCKWTPPTHAQHWFCNQLVFLLPLEKTENEVTVALRQPWAPIVLEQEMRMTSCPFLWNTLIFLLSSFLALTRTHSVLQAKGRVYGCFKDTEVFQLSISMTNAFWDKKKATSNETCDSFSQL